MRSRYGSQDRRAEEILKRPAECVIAAKGHSEPELTGLLSR